jgi:hypothetical protein
MLTNSLFLGYERYRIGSFLINRQNQAESTASADEATDQAESTAPDEGGPWMLEIRGIVLTAIGGDDSVPYFYTTGSPNCL